MSENGNIKLVWKESPLFWGALAVSFAIMVFIFFDGLEKMVAVWESKEEYGHGFLLPVISIMLILQNKDKLERVQFTGSWLGVFLVVIGIILFFAGAISAIWALVQYAFLVTLFGVVLSIVGNNAIKLLLVPLIFLFFMVPLPQFLFYSLSANLQLISSQLGVAVIRLFDISVFLEGNVIDLGAFKLQVVEACSGLRYLFPLMSLAFLSAYLYKAALWKRVIIFLSSIPVTVLMNSFRIGVIGVLVEYGGPEQAEGFLHDFEGWIVFMLCIMILIGEMWLFTKIGSGNLPLRETFGLEYPEPTPKDANVQFRKLPKQFVVVIMMLCLSVFTAQSLEQREEIIAKRSDFSEFPMELGEWSGKQGSIEQIYLDSLKLDDYIMADYVNNNHNINFYSAYYASQRTGSSTHSPRACIPGGGWKIDELNQKQLNATLPSGEPLNVNRLLIKKGEHKQIVYYWFQQRGRNMTNEYLVKWYLFWDALTKNRSDGSLVRLTMLIKPGEDLAEADRRLAEFSGLILPKLGKYIPE